MPDEPSNTGPTTDTTPAPPGMQVPNGGQQQDTSEPDEHDSRDGADDHGLSDAGKKALAEERKGRRAAEKARKDLEAEVQKYKQRDMTDQQRLEAARDEHKTRADSAESALLRYKVATEAGLDAKLIPRLQGSTESELLADAQELKKLQPTHVPDFDGGTRTPAEAPKSMSDFIRAAVRNR